MECEIIDKCFEYVIIVRVDKKMTNSACRMLKDVYEKQTERE